MVQDDPDKLDKREKRKLMLIDGGINKVQPALSDHSASYFNNSELALVN